MTSSSVAGLLACVVIATQCTEAAAGLLQWAFGVSLFPMVQGQLAFVVGLVVFSGALRKGIDPSDAVARLDAWTHRRCWNPLFTFVQRMFHVNRFTLIAACIVGEILMACGVISYAILRTASIGTNVVTTQIVLVFVIVSDLVRIDVRHVLGELMRCSRAFERHGYAKVDAETLVLFRPRMRMRSFIMVLVYWFFTTDIHHFVTDEQFSLASVPIDFFVFGVWGYIHLFDGDDIDPRNRTYLFDGQQAHEEA